MSWARISGRGGGGGGRFDHDFLSGLHLLGALLRLPPSEETYPSSIHSWILVREASGRSLRCLSRTRSSLSPASPRSARNARRWLGVLAHADRTAAGAGAVLRRRAQIAAAPAARPSAMNWDVDIAPKTEPRGSPRKISIVKRRIAYPKR